MSRFLLFTLILCSRCVYAQTETEEIKKVITTLFTSMQKGDTARFRSCFVPGAHLQTAWTNPKNLRSILITEPLDSFIKKITYFHNDTTIIEERILNYDVKTDGALASVWAPYEFYVNGRLSHSGVDAFQFFKDESGWKIIQLCDTRKKP